jgi:hypothetical protein
MDCVKDVPKLVEEERQVEEPALMHGWEIVDRIQVDEGENGAGAIGHYRRKTPRLRVGLVQPADDNEGEPIARHRPQDWTGEPITDHVKPASNPPDTAQDVDKDLISIKRKDIVVAFYLLAKLVTELEDTILKGA